MSDNINIEPKAMAGTIPVYCAHEEIVEIGKLIPNPKNPNQHPEKQLQLLANIIKGQGWRAPITVSKRSGYIVKGHGRYKAAQVLGTSFVPVDYQEYANEAQEYADLIADNRIAELSQMNEVKLAEMIKEMESSGDILDIKFTGFDETDLNKLLQQVADQLGTKLPNDADDLPKMPDEPEQLITQPGDLWILGEHRLLCGDATNLEHARKLMNGQRANAVHIDPPYGVDYDPKDGNHQPIKNDDKTEDELIKLLSEIFKVAYAITEDKAAFYIWYAWATHKEFDYSIEAAGLIEKQCIIWSKPMLLMGHNDYQWAHEPCYYCAKDGQKPEFYGDRSQGTIWRVSYRTKEVSAMVIGTGVVILEGNGNKIFIAPKPPKNKKARTMRINQDQELYIYKDDDQQDLWEIAQVPGKPIHPSQKPVEIPMRAIENSTKPGQIVWDGCLGSGSTLIAAEVTGRKCYGTEITQYYCDMIVKRWETMTGKKAIRQENYLGLTAEEQEVWRIKYYIEPKKGME